MALDRQLHKRYSRVRARTKSNIKALDKKKNIQRILDESAIVNDIQCLVELANRLFLTSFQLRLEMEEESKTKKVEDTN